MVCALKEKSAVCTPFEAAALDVSHRMIVSFCQSSLYPPSPIYFSKRIYHPQMSHGQTWQCTHPEIVCL